MKKIMGISLVTMGGLFLAACGNDANENGGNAEAENGAAENQTENEENAEAAEEEITLSFGMQQGTQSNEYAAAERLAEYLEEESDGAVTLNIYPDAQLGTDLDMLGEVEDGTLDITLSEAGRFGEWVPRAELLMLAYMIDDFAHLERVLYDTSYGEELLDELEQEHGMRVVDTAYNGTRQTTSSSEIQSIDDMAGLSLRVPEAQNLLDYAEYTGANPTPMAFDEVYLALQTGQVDAQENPLSLIEANSFYEVQDYLIMTHHVVNDANYVVSQQTWDELSEEHQTMLEEGIAEAVDLHTSLFEEEEEELVAFFEEEGMTVIEPDLAPFEEALEDSYDHHLENIGEGAEEYMQVIEDARE
ncbi:DctP family TRAP transporter solute-binding subunit [Alkalicoccus luteus]|uniref:DctP family TRAP transporter solute-binding subunit n=1 Tax=Alkalicoccus luteus TaxID=1237094 RepID=UPI004034E997